WDPNFKGVWHLGDETGTTLSTADSTSNGNGTNHSATSASGQIDGAANVVSASSQYISVANSPLPADANTWTISAWLKPTSTALGSAITYPIVFGQGAGWRGLWLFP